MSLNLKRPITVGLLVAMLAVVFSVAPAFAQDETPDLPPLEISDFVPTHPSLAPELADLSGEVAILVEFEGTPASVAYATTLETETRDAAVRAAQSALTVNLDQQAAAAPALKSLGAVELYSMQRILNAVVVLVDASEIPAIQAIPGVKGVAQAPIHEIDHATSIPYINVDQIWDVAAGYGYTGDGLSIGIIDTGIDYLHLGFDGDPSEYANQDPTVVGDVTFPTAKVVGGYDFTGDNYDASGEAGSTIPNPDPDPTDCNGHGSHVAGTAGGFGVYEEGGDYFSYTNITTSYDAGTIASNPGSGWVIGPGAAPNADLWALKVFGCDGSTAVTLEAIEFSVDPNGDGDFSDRLDVINLSLGASAGIPEDATVVGINNAALAGVIPVLSAGNSGDNFFITGSPGIAQRAISTAAVNDPDIESATLTVDGEVYAAFPAGYGPALPAVTTGTLETPSGEPTGCDPADFDGFTAGNIALIDRGACSFVTKTRNAQTAGASIAVVTNVTTNLPFSMGGDGTQSDITIPSFMISGDAGDVIKTLLPVDGTLDPTGFSQAGTIVDFSSRGPIRPNLDGDILLKPDIAAPGVNITSVQTGYDGTIGFNGWESSTLSGTSMASPHMAGVMTLLREAYPDYSVEELKAVALNYADGGAFVFDALNNTFFPDPAAASRTGAGIVLPPLAFDSADLVAYGLDDAGAVHVSFDPIDITEDTFVTENVLLKNKGEEFLYFDATNLGIFTNTDNPGITFFVSDVTAQPGGIADYAIPPGGVAVVEVTAFFEYSAITHNRDSTLAVEEFGNWLGEESGILFVGATNFAGTEFYNPYVVLYSPARPASSMEAVSAEIDFEPVTGTTAYSDTGDITLEGITLNNDAAPATPSEDYQSLVSAFELLYTDDTPDAPTPRFDGADIQYLGAQTDAGGTSYIGLAMEGNWEHPYEQDYYVCFDLDQDRTGGVFGDGTDWCFIVRGDFPGDTMEIGLWDVNNLMGLTGGPTGATIFTWNFPNGVSPEALDTRMILNNVMFVPGETSPALWTSSVIPLLDTIFGSDLATNGWTTSGTDAAEAFDVYAYTFSLYNGLLIDITPTQTYDPADTAVTFPNGPVYLDQPGEIPFVLDAPVGATLPDLLVLHHHNAEGERVDVVSIDTGVTSLAQNGSFEEDPLSDTWTSTGALIPYPTARALDGDRIGVIFGDGGNNIIAQGFDVSGTAGDTMLLSYGITGIGVNSTANGARVVLLSGGSVVQVENCIANVTGTPAANPDPWQQVSCAFEATADYDQVILQMGALGLSAESILAFDQVGLVVDN